MNSFTKKGIVQKTIISIIIVISTSFIIPLNTYAVDFGDLGGSLLKEVMQLVSSLGDIAMGALNNFMLGAEGFGAAMISIDNSNLENEESWLYLDKDTPDIEYEFEPGEINTNSFYDEKGSAKFKIPNLLYSPENIFANNIASLDVNFLRKNTYQAITNTDLGASEKEAEKAEAKSKSAAGNLKQTISNWYVSFRNIAIVGLLSVLIYIGIRIIISSTAGDKAKYKESLKNWLVALCLIFVIHFIMSGILMITDKITELFAQDINRGITVKAYGETTSDCYTFKTNLIGIIRFRAQSSDAQQTTAYTIIYVVLVVYTFMFTFTYYKRFLYTAFFTMIAPLVALTYPIDKAGDGQAQAFNMWFKEYTMNVIIQPVHLVLYIVFVKSAGTLAQDNPIYAIVAIGFLITAEKFIKKMFGLDKAETAGGLGGFAGGALAMQGMQKLAGAGKKAATKGLSGGGSSSEGNPLSDSKIKFAQSNAGNSDEESKGKESKVKEYDSRLNDEQKAELKAEGIKPGDQEYGHYLAGHGIKGEDPLALQQNSDVENNGLGKVNKNNGGAPAKQEKWKRKLAARAANTGIKKLWKSKRKIARGVLGTAAKITGAGVGATIGLAAGVASGDPSKAFQYAATGGVAGGMIGQKGYNFAEKGVDGVGSLSKKAGNAKNNAINAINEEKYGKEYARRIQNQKQNEDARKAFMKSEEEQKKWSEVKENIGYEGSNKEFMEKIADYKQAGMTDENNIKSIAKRDLVQEKGKNHDDWANMGGFANKNGFDREYIENKDKSAQFKASVVKQYKDKETQDKILKMFSQMHGREFID